LIAARIEVVIVLIHIVISIIIGDRCPLNRSVENGARQNLIPDPIKNKRQNFYCKSGRYKGALKKSLPEFW
jgi:hypothetical protein